MGTLFTIQNALYTIWERLGLQAKINSTRSGIRHLREYLGKAWKASTVTSCLWIRYSVKDSLYTARKEEAKG